ncbi:EAL domain-containing protein [Acidithiobacillus sp. AMEEHan]|uniref:EAL domain-containing protein n=1 Tax=Acidithiobacillus sp. AMEEHan TaxID=2994951 RepID=UPI0027E43703|nr:EAL domain-containing protein [Acidithiobacillus sp. AMEEHan]
MKTTSTLPNFLGLRNLDFQIIDRYRGILEAEALALAQSFYDYLLSHPVTAAVFRDFSQARLNALIQKQVEHVRALLASHLEKSWRESIRTLGALHHHFGIEPSWIAGGYVLYWRHWQKALQEQVPAGDRSLLRDALFRLLVGDLMIQLEGYAQASRETDAERLALFNVLLEVLAVPSTNEAPRMDGLLQQICEALPRKSANVRLAGYVVTSAMEETLTLECMAGLPFPTVQIPKSAGDPCWRALESGHVVIQPVEDPQAPEWIHSLRRSVEEIGFFPFGAEDLRGVGVIGVREKGYFRRVGSIYFDAFTHLGTLVLLLRNQALRDQLTALPNRALFLDRLEIARAQSLRNERLLGVALLDLDGFKQVNDRLGHAAGDQLLQAVVQRLQAQLRAGDTLARMGGDEFGLLLPGLERLDDLHALCERLLSTIRESVDIQGEAVSVSGSLGVTLYPLDDNDSATLIRHADMALYAAKDAGRDQFHLHTLALDDAVLEEAEMRVLLEQALQEGYLVLHYQPIVSRAGAVLGVEALLRLQHPEKGLLSPAAFFPVLDHPHLARPIGRFALDTALRQGEIWQREGLSLRISVNISARHLLDTRFLKDLQEALARHPSLPPEQFEIEITESAPLADLAEAQSLLAACHRLGVRIALDDFGTGNASLSYLQKLPIHTIKIDQGFVRDMIQDPKDLAIVAGVITTARMLGLEVIAEGVETLEYAALLTKMGSVRLQGYLFSKPIPAERIPGWIKQFRLAISPMENALTPMNVLPPVLDAQLLRVQEFLRALRGEISFPAQVLEDNAEEYCHLGRWLRGEGALLFGQAPEFADLLDRHERLHQIARRAKAFLDAGDTDAALQQGHLLEQENRILLEKMQAISSQHGDSIGLK